jgi:hypothetical protein
MPAAAIEALDATVRAACERVRDRVNDLKAGAVPANDVDDVAFELEKDIDRADAALLDLRAALLASSSPSTTTNADAAASSSRATPPVAAYRASLNRSRDALCAIRRERVAKRGAAAVVANDMWRGTVRWWKDVADSLGAAGAKGEDASRGAENASAGAAEPGTSGRGDYAVAAGYYEDDGATRDARDDEREKDERAGLSAASVERAEEEWRNRRWKRADAVEMSPVSAPARAPVADEVADEGVELDFNAARRARKAREEKEEEEERRKRKAAAAAAATASSAPNDADLIGMYSAPPPGKDAIKRELFRSTARSDDALRAASRMAYEAEETGEGILRELMTQRESIQRSKNTVDELQVGMRKNEKLIDGMNSWTRLGFKPGRRWGFF